jgi:hypothetical protein
MNANTPATPPAQPQPSPAASQPSTQGKRKLQLDPGVATVLATLITVIGAGIGWLIVHFFPSAGSPNPENSPTSAASTSYIVPASVTIYPPKNGDITHQTSFSGGVTNLQPGQSVWTFFQVMGKGGKINPTTYPTEGPCVIDFSSQTWKCDNVYVGHVSDNETYQICPAILNLSQSAEVVKFLENAAADSALHNKSLVYWFASPPSYINQKICTPAHRVN